MGIPGGSACPQQIVAGLQNPGGPGLVVGGQIPHGELHGDSGGLAGSDQGRLRTGFICLIGLLQISFRGGDIDLQYFLAGPSVGSVFYRRGNPDAGSVLRSDKGGFYVGNRKIRVGEAEAEGPQHIFPEGIEVAVAYVKIFPVNRDRTFLKTHAAVGFRVQSVIFVLQNIFRMVLVKTEVLCGGIAVVGVRDGKGQFSGGRFLSRQKVRHRGRALFSAGTDKEHGADGGIAVDPGQICQTVGVDEKNHVGEGAADTVNQCPLAVQKLVVIDNVAVTFLAAGAASEDKKRCIRFPGRLAEQIFGNCNLLGLGAVLAEEVIDHAAGHQINAGSCQLLKFREGILRGNRREIFPIKLIDRRLRGKPRGCAGIRDGWDFLSHEGHTAAHAAQVRAVGCPAENRHGPVKKRQKMIFVFQQDDGFRGNLLCQSQPRVLRRVKVLLCHKNSFF